MAGQLSFYDILDVLPGASADEIQQSYAAKARAIAPDMIAGAPSKVVAAVGRAEVALQAALRVLGDPEGRRRYDTETGIRQTGGGLAGLAHTPSAGIWAWDPSWNVRGGALTSGAVTEALGALADWLAPRPASPRRIAAPDVRGLFVGPARRLLGMHGLHAELIQLTRNPMPVEGLVVDQSPRAGATLRPSGTIAVQVWHPARRGGGQP